MSMAMNAAKALLRIWVFLVAICFAIVAQAGQPIIAMYGDSTTLGTTLFPGTGNGYYTTGNNEPALLQDGLPTAIIENHGVVGATCDDLLNGRGGIRKNWWLEMAASKASIVVVNVGMNDALNATGGEDAYSQCLGDLIRIAQGDGKIVVIETPNPSTWNAAWGFPGYVESYAQSAVGAALGNSAFVIDQWTYDQNLLAWQSHLSDGIHPDDILYAYKATIALGVLGPLVKTLALSS